jgi:hypothetical protein
MARAFAAPTLQRARKKKRTAKKPDVPSPFVASGESTSPERGGGDSENAVRGRPRTSLGDGVVKLGGRRIAWAQLLVRVDWADAGVKMITVRSASSSARRPRGTTCG